MIFSEGDELDLYLDPQNKDIKVGRGRLVKYVSTGLPFILVPPVVYNLEEWVVYVIESDTYPKGFTKKFKFRYIESLGIVHTNEAISQTDYQLDVFAYDGVDNSFWASRVDGSELSVNEIY